MSRTHPPGGQGSPGVFRNVGRNLLAAEAVAGVGHHVALSVVGTDRPARERLLSREDGSGKSD